jgi:hypothetical protein
MKSALLFVFTAFIFSSFGQIKAFDKLEMWYAQHHYKTVYRKSTKYAQDPEYNFSKVPQLYAFMSALQLSKSPSWLSRNPEVLDQAVETFNALKASENGKKVLEAHVYELAYLKIDLESLVEDLIQKGNADLSKKYTNLIASCFGNLPDADALGQIENVNTDDADLSSDAYAGERIAIIDFAKTHIGIPYVWAGTDTSGFDCSGFTGYIMKNAGKTVPRRAIDQYTSSTKITEKTAKSGDLIFFDNGSGISHVGIVVSNNGEELTMIHASSSKGIIITDVKQSSYWLPRLYGFGTYLY